MTLRLTILGCDGSWPGPGGACSSYLLRTETTAVLVDMGTGSLANLQRHFDPTALDAIVLTHEHPDHCANIADLNVLLMFDDNGPHELPVYASAGVREQVFPRNHAPLQYTWTEVEDGDELEVGDIDITFSRTDHPVTTHGIRADHDGRSLVYSADSGVEWSMSSLGDDIDLALFEAVTTSDRKHAGHMNSVQAAQMAKGAGRLMLTHIRPPFDHKQICTEAAAEFDGDVLLAVAGETYEV